MKNYNKHRLEENFNSQSKLRTFSIDDGLVLINNGSEINNLENKYPPELKPVINKVKFVVEDKGEKKDL
jgi:hypothetical protein